jgi:hypothetical protein
MIALLLELLVGWIYRRTLSLPALSSAQRWALAAGANLARLNGSSLDSLCTQKLPRTDRYILRKWWRVEDAEGLRRTMAWLASEGHRADFQRIHASLHAGRDGQFLSGGATQEESPVMEFILRNHSHFKNGNLLAWDLGRLINVARFGFSSGYLSANEAWETILAAARALASEYASWEELSDNYLLGFSYWQDGAEPDQFLQKAATWLKADPGSPWRRLAWSDHP